MRSLALCAALLTAGCREPARPVAPPDRPRTTPPRSDATSPTRSDATAQPDATIPARAPVRCVIDGPDHALAAMPLTRLRIAAHGHEAMLVAEYTSSFAPEPAGDAVDTHAWRWWRFDLQNPSMRDAPRGQSDPLGARPRRVEPDSESVCAYAQWGEDAARPVWEGERWTRWRHASSWGGPACSPCGSLTARVGADPGRAEERERTDVLQEWEVSGAPGAPFSAAIVQRYDYRGPTDDDHNACSESAIALLWRAANERSFTERELARWRADDARRPVHVAVASNGRTRVIVTQSSEERARIELRLVSAEGRAIGAPRLLYAGANIGFINAAFVDDTLVLLWNERSSPAPSSPSIVRWTQLDPTRDPVEAPAPQTLLDRRPLTIDELSLASDGATIALVWAEKPDRSTGTALRFAAGSSLSQWRAQLVAGGQELFRTTHPGSIYRSSIAVDRDRAWVAFDEPLRGYNARPRVRSLRCEPAPSP